MISKEKTWVVIGKFGRPQGLNGLVRVFSFTDPKSNLYDYNPWYIKINNRIEKITPVDLKTSSKFDLVKISGYESREQLAMLTNAEIIVEETQLPILAENEYYWHELIDMDVQTIEGVHLGKITEMLATGANDVMIVEGEKKFLIPYIHDDFIVKIDNNNKLITVNWDLEF